MSNVGPAWWRHQMDTILRYWPFMRGIHRSPVDSSHKGQWREALLFSLICAWTIGWANNRDASDLRRHSCHYYVTVMRISIIWLWHGHGFSIIGPLWGIPAVIGWFPHKGSVISLNMLLKKQSSCQWFLIPWHPWDVIIPSRWALYTDHFPEFHHFF